MSTGFDFIIIGGGTAGCVLASRLSNALPHLTILLVEAGPASDHRVTTLFGYIAGSKTEIEWDHYTVPQPELNGKVLSQWQGKILGGSSAINYMGWTRGAKADFDQWAAQIDDQKWSWENLLPFFKKSETFYPSPRMAASSSAMTQASHGSEGPIKVTVPFPATTIDKPKELMAQVYESIGTHFNGDCNSGFPEGYNERAWSAHDGKRQHAAMAYPFGSNVTVWTGVLAEKLVFEGLKCVGVSVVKEGGEKVEVRAGKNVLLCAGVQGSAKLLLLSGVGPKHELARQGISQIADLPVGENYSDHPCFQTFWSVEDPSTLADPATWMAWHRHDDVIQKLRDEKVIDGKEYELLMQKGKVHTESFVMNGHIDLFNTNITAPTNTHPNSKNFTLISLLVSPLSRGTLTLQSHNPTDTPILDPRVLTHPADRTLLYALSRSLIPALTSSPYGVTEYGYSEYDAAHPVLWIENGIHGKTSDAALRVRLNKAGETLNHGSGTCALGKVVDGDCKVLGGVEGLRVVDASIFPAPVGGHLQAAIYAVAEMIAAVIAEECAVVK